MSKRHSPLLNRLVRAGVTVGLAASLATPGCKKDTPAPAATAVPATPPAPAPAAPVAPTAPADVAAPPAPPEAAPAPVAPAAPEAADAAAAPVPSPRTPLSPATLERRTGKVAATVIDAATLAPKGRQATGGAVYLSVPADRYVDGDPGDLTGRLTVLGDRAGVAVLTRPTDPGSSSWQILVRLTGDTLPEKVELDVAVGPARSRWNGYVAWKRGTIALGTISDAPEDKGLEKAFHEALATSLESQNNPFYAFAASRLRAMASGDKAATGGDFGGQAARSDLGDTMALYTGLTSIEESLQADRGLRLRGEAAEKRTLALDTITPVTAAAHDWPKLLEGRTPVIEPLARVVPADKLYMHFHDLRMAVRFGREVDEWLTPVLPIMEWRAGPTHLVEQLQTQLMIERTALSEALGNLAADGVAFVVGDPFIREGTDVSVVFKVKDQTLLNTSLAVYEAKARSEFGAELKDEAYEVRGKKVRHVYTADRVVDQHRIELGDVLIVSNSKAAIERFAAIADGAEKPLADSGDFQFMRARYPFSTDAAVEDGFVFVSDAFVAKAVSPRSRILEARRMAALADLRAVGYGTLLHGLLSGTAATTREALLGAGVLAEADWKHADGTEITLDADKGPSSTVWGRPSFMTPLDELDIGKVSESEKLAYDRFRDTYQNYWRTFIDPIGLRIDVDPAKNRIAFDMAIMPLIDGTDYSDLREKAGDASYVPATADGIAQWTIGIGEKSSLRRDIDGLAGLLGRTDINFSWLGDFAFAGMMGGGAVNDLAILSGEVPEIGERRAGRDRDMVPVLDKAPLYAGVQVKNPLAFAATLAALRGFIQTAAPGMLEWGDGGTYRDVPITRVGAKTSNFDLGHDADLVYAIPAGVFVVSFDRGALDRLIDQVLDGTQVRLPKEGEANASPTQADFRVAVGEDDPSLRTLGYLVMEGEAVRQWQVAHRDAELFVRTFGVLPVGDAGKRKALAYLGFEPAVTQGGAFELAGNGRLTHSIYGTIAEPNLVALPVEGSPLGKLIDGLASLGLQLGFEGEGQTSGLHVTGAWTRTK